ncbi:CHRD domain-containing protein [Streptomyces sp. NPDC054887]
MNGTGTATAGGRRGVLISTVAVAVAGLALAASPAAAGGAGPSARGGAESGASYFVAALNGANEVPVTGGPAAGDKDGVALEFVKIKGGTVSFAVKWRGTGRPTALHIHQGARGVNGGMKIDLTEQLGVREGRGVGQGRAEAARHGEWRTATGAVKVADAALLTAFETAPTGFYANLHTAEFPGGAVRGQFHAVAGGFDTGRALRAFSAPVLKGEQIYGCEEGPDGRRAFRQRDVRAVLAGGIAHSFVRPNSGTPQWIAPDGSAVTGSVVSRTPNGDGNIPELVLRAEQAGAKHGLLARTAEILRLNTVGGTAPAGDCETGARAAVPYQADYVFLPR